MRTQTTEEQAPAKPWTAEQRGEVIGALAAARRGVLELERASAQVNGREPRSGQAMFGEAGGFADMFSAAALGDMFRGAR